MITSTDTCYFPIPHLVLKGKNYDLSDKRFKVGQVRMFLCNVNSLPLSCQLSHIYQRYYTALYRLLNTPPTHTHPAVTENNNKADWSDLFIIYNTIKILVLQTIINSL